MRYVAVAMVLCCTLNAQSPTLECEVASIKRNTADLRDGPSGTMPNMPKGQIRLVKIPARLLVLRAYPVATVPAEVVNVPSWADSERYDATVKYRPHATADDVRGMWQRLLADRLKLSAHYEPRDVRGYKLVVARRDGKLGPELKPSTLACPAPDPTKPAAGPPQAVTDAMRPGAAITAETEQLLMSQCRLTMNVGNTTYAGSTGIGGLVMALRFGGIREPIEDATGLQGLYAFKLTFSRDALGQRTSDDAPSIFSALQEQLGLKLESITIRSEAVVIDHIERPTEN